MDPGGMINETGTYNLAEIWPFPINGGVTDHSSMRNGDSFGGSNYVHPNLISSTNCGSPAQMSHMLSKAVAAGISGDRKRRYAARDKVVSVRDGNDVNDGDSKKQKTSGFVDEVCDGKVETGSSDQKKQLPEPPKDYIHVRARRGQATDSHSLAERARREKISERMKILQDLVPGCNKVIGKALVLDEIINYVQSLQRQVEFLSMKLEAVNSRVNPGIEFYSPKEPFENPGMKFSSQQTREYSRGATPEWLHMQLGGDFERTS